MPPNQDLRSAAVRELKLVTAETTSPYLGIVLCLAATGVIALVIHALRRLNRRNSTSVLPPQSDKNLYYPEKPTIMSTTQDDSTLPAPNADDFGILNEDPLGGAFLSVTSADLAELADRQLLEGMPSPIDDGGMAISMPEQYAQIFQNNEFHSEMLVQLFKEHDSDVVWKRKISLYGHPSGESTSTGAENVPRSTA